jgi:hypothetical protein
MTDPKINVLFYEFNTRVWVGRKPLIAQKAILQYEMSQLDTICNQGSETAVRKYLEIQYKKLRSAKLLIEQIRKDKDLLTSLQTIEQINKIYLETISK